MSEELLQHFKNLADATSEPPDYTLAPLLPVGLVVMGGPPKAYKSTLTSAMVAYLTGHECGFLPVGYRRAPFKGPVVWFSDEADAGVLRHMMETDLGVKLSKDYGIHVCDEPWDWKLDGEKADRIFELLEFVKPIALVIDPLRNFHELNENDSADMMRILNPLARWSHDNKATTIVVHHTGKPGEGQQRVNAMNLRGSSAIFGKADGVLMLNPGKQEGRVEIECIQKRAERWTRHFNLGAWGQQAYEVPDSATINILSGMRKGATGAALLQLSGCTEQQVDSALDLAHRNGWLLTERIELSYSGIQYIDSRTKKAKE